VWSGISTGKTNMRREFYLLDLSISSLERSLPVESPLLVPKTPSTFHHSRNETLSVVAMRVRNPDCSPVGIQG
jgi:hypothetical protein